jgi:glycosyltransferase involved in cell wall biosynthesis
MNSGQASATGPVQKPPLIVVLMGPPLPLDQGYRHGAYNDLVQLLKYRTLHLLICNGTLIWDYDPSLVELNLRELRAIPGISSVTFFPLNKDDRHMVWKAAEFIWNFIGTGRLLVGDGVFSLVRKIRDLSLEHNCSEVHFGMTASHFVDCAAAIRKFDHFAISFTAHNIEANEIKVDMEQALLRKSYGRAAWYWLKHTIVLSKELKACRGARFVIAIAYRDHVRFLQKGVNSRFIPPYVHMTTHVETPAQSPAMLTIVVLGHLAYSATGGGVEQFMNVVVPKLKERVPSVRVRLIGKDASAEVLAACKKYEVSYEGFVQDLNDVWREMSVLAAPLLVDKGIRIRILEATMRRLPVVTTVQGSTGFENANSFLCIAENFDSFAELCITLLTSKEEYETQRARIERYVNEYLSLPAIQEKWQEVWSNPLSAKNARAPQ